MGSFCRYTIVCQKNIIPLPDDISYKEGCYFFINPWSVETIIATCKKNKWKTVVITAACSSFGRMLNNACQDNDIKLINIVRRQEQIDILNAQCSAEIILNSQEVDFLKKLEKIFDEFKPDVFYDSVTGKVGTKVLWAMPSYTTIVIFGRLDSRGYDLDDDDYDKDEMKGKE